MSARICVCVCVRATLYSTARIRTHAKYPLLSHAGARTHTRTHTAINGWDQRQFRRFSQLLLVDAPYMTADSFQGMVPIAQCLIAAVLEVPTEDTAACVRRPCMKKPVQLSI